MRLAREEQQSDRDQLRVISLLIDLNPFPQWIKRLDTEPSGAPAFRMLRINAAYERRWGIKRERYEGKLDSEVWPPDIAESFRDNDLVAVGKAPEPYLTWERVPDLASRRATPNGEEVPVWRIAKVATRAGAEVYVAGIAVRSDEVEEMAEAIGIELK